MNIVLGVCGFGLGHSTRQRPILEGLNARGHRVLLIGNDQSYHFFAENYPEVPLQRVYVPLMHTTPHGLDFLRTAHDPRNVQPEAVPAFWEACATIERAFGRPDLVISDYEMVSAQVAYLFGTPLITLDQQSKFLGYDLPAIGDFNPSEHRLRLGYFFPKAALRVATSFFRIESAPVADYPVTIIPPILGQDVRQIVAAPRPGQVTIYLSAASRIAQSNDELAAILAQFPDYTFSCFVEGAFSQPPPNVIAFRPTRAAFLESLAQSMAVIATAGHNLITEALYLKLPLYLLPFDHYEQQINAAIIAREGLGIAASHVTEAALRAFLVQSEAYRQRNSPLIYRTFDGDRVFLDMIQAFSSA